MKFLVALGIGIATIVIGTPSANASTLYVPSEHATLADALLNAAPSDTILLEPGTYSGPGFTNLSVDFGFPLTIGSTAGAEATIIEAGGASVLNLTGESSQRPTSTNSSDQNAPHFIRVYIYGLSFRHSHYAIDIGSASEVWVQECVFQENLAGIVDTGLASGGGISQCSFMDNEYGIWLYDETAYMISSCLFLNNFSGITLDLGLDPDIVGSVFAWNNVGIQYRDAYALVSASTFYGNNVGVMDYGTLPSHVSFDCNNFHGNVNEDYYGQPDQTGLNGNFSAEQYFCDTTLVTGTNVRPMSSLLPENNSCGLNIGNVSVGCSCCMGPRGSVQISSECDYADQMVDVADLTDLIEHLFITFDSICCPDEADIAPESSPDGVVDVADLTLLIDHLFINFPSLSMCP